MGLDFREIARTKDNLEDIVKNIYDHLDSLNERIQILENKEKYDIQKHLSTLESRVRDLENELMALK
jgi:hypothetical protein